MKTLKNATILFVVLCLTSSLTPTAFSGEKVLGIGGTVTNSGVTVGDGYVVVITNVNKPQFSRTTTTRPDGSYSEGFINPSNNVVEDGDVIEVVVQSKRVF